jgi:uncharacterized lipoprotein YddW (UPF0748 family)
VCSPGAWSQGNALDEAGGQADARSQARRCRVNCGRRGSPRWTTFDWPSKTGLSTEQARQELLELVELADRLKLNALVFQVRPHADALYESKLGPWSEYLTGEAGKVHRAAWDPLAFIIEQSHRRGIQVHAWFNPYCARHPAGKSPIPNNHVKKTMPDAVHQLGESRPDGSAKWLWMDPADPRLQQHTLAVIADVLDRYGLNTNHFDDYFYPPNRPTRTEKHSPTTGCGISTNLPGANCRAPASVARPSMTWWNNMPERSASTSRTWCWASRRSASTGPVTRITSRASTNTSLLYADPYRWLQEGWVDYLAPQLYWQVRNPDQSFVGLLDWWQANNPQSRHIWAGLYTSCLLDEKPKYDDAELPAQVRWTRVIGEPSAGHIHFSIQALQSDARGITESLAKLYDKPALHPASPWMNVEAPERAQAQAKRAGKTLTIEVNKSSREQGLQWAVQV